MAETETVCTIDFETRSFLNVKDVGAWRYAEDFTTEILCMAYKFDAGETKLWTPDLPFPQEILDHIEAGGLFEAHNVQFERAVWILILARQYNIPIPKRWRDTMAACAYRGLPLSLDQVGKALKLAVQKDQQGKYLLQTLSVPKWGTKKEPDRIYREDFDLMLSLFDYCMQDVDSEHNLSETVGPLPRPEYRLWCLDQKINQRGVQLDVEAVKGALKVAEIVETKLNKELAEITGGTVTAASQRDRLLKWLNEEGGLSLIDNLRKETLEELLATDEHGGYKLRGHIPDDALRALEIRATLAKASTKKYVRMIECVNEDGRIRGMLQYHGAGTGRWAGRLVQPHNFPRPFIKHDMEELCQLIREKDIPTMEVFFQNPMNVLSNCLRGMFIAAPDHVLRICDFSAIEARVTFWVANCQVGLEVFHKSDRKESEDIYCVTASDLVGYEVKKAEHGHERQLGKITVLGCGYQMGWSKLQFQAEKDYGVILDDDTAQKMVSLYRDKYEEVKWFWYGLNDAAIATVQTGQPHSYNAIWYDLIEDTAGTWLACVLPNHRRLWYYEPAVVNVETEWGRKDQLMYMGRDNKKGGAWGPIRTYGGMLTENVVQAIARDLMAEAMIRVERAGYPIILTVHDEIIAETPKDFGSQEEFEELMCGIPDWAAGCPIAVEGGAVTRYQKI